MPRRQSSKAKVPARVPGQATLQKEGRKLRLLERLRLGEPWAEAASAVGVCERTAANWRKKDPEYAAAVDAARDAAIAKVESTTYELCLNKDSRHNALRIFYLKAKAGWKDRRTKKSAQKRVATVLPEVAEHALAAGIKKHEALKKKRSRRGPRVA
jgi:hypothetical protein